MGFYATKAIVKYSFVIDPPHQSVCCVMRAASREKCLVLKKAVDSKIVLRSVFFFSTVRNNARKMKSCIRGVSN
jgi:hypothetical protein